MKKTKLTEKELAKVTQYIVDATIEYVNLFCDKYKTKRIDIKIVNAFHVGISSAFGEFYTDSQISKALNAAINILQKMQDTEEKALKTKKVTKTVKPKKVIKNKK